MDLQSPTFLASISSPFSSQNAVSPFFSRGQPLSSSASISLISAAFYHPCRLPSQPSPAAEAASTNTSVAPPPHRNPQVSSQTQHPPLPQSCLFILTVSIFFIFSLILCFWDHICILFWFYEQISMLGFYKSSLVDAVWPLPCWLLFCLKMLDQKVLYRSCENTNEICNLFLIMMYFYLFISWFF